jgi:hypothetical protein
MEPKMNVGVSFTNISTDLADFLYKIRHVVFVYWCMATIKNAVPKMLVRLAVSGHYSMGALIRV